MSNTSPQANDTAPDILVVDDTPANLQLLSGMLKDQGYRVRPVPSGKLAIQAVQTVKPDLILLDINMPEMNGYEVCKHLKADDTLKDIPVLFISALNETADKVKAFAAGGVDYVTKPFQFEEVEARVQTHLTLRRTQLELEQRNRELHANNEKLRKLEALRDNLTDMVIHDLRSPLMGITGSLEVLEMDAGLTLNTGDLALLKNARSSGLILTSMVTSLLDISRLEQGQMPLSMARQDIHIVIRNAVDSLGSLAGHVSLLQPEQSQPEMVNCDASLTTRVVANLVANAVKFTPQDGTVEITVEHDATATKVSVADTGYGIPREYHERIFEKFGQVEARRQRKMYSTGLGLTFCKLAVEAQGGKIGVESETGKGSTFWFTLPQ